MRYDTESVIIAHLDKLKSNNEMSNYIRKLILDDLNKKS